MYFYLITDWHRITVNINLKGLANYKISLYLSIYLSIYLSLSLLTMKTKCCHILAQFIPNCSRRKCSRHAFSLTFQTLIEEENEKTGSHFAFRGTFLSHRMVRRFSVGSITIFTVSQLSCTGICRQRGRSWRLS